MAVLGAIIAGGKSVRFGSDKAAAIINGVAMIEQVHAALREQVDAVIVCGRTWADWPMVADLPVPGLGPLGGLNAALAYARSNGFEHVVSVPVDTLPLPTGLVGLLSPAPAAFSAQPLIGMWPASLGGQLSRHLQAGQRSVRSWIEASGCRPIDDGIWGLRNINRPDDLHGS